MEVANIVVLKILNFSDTQKIVHAFSKESGYLSFISPSSLFRKKSCTVNLFQVCEVEFFPNEKGNFQKLKSVSPLLSFSNIYLDIYKMNIIVLWSEILNLILKNEQKNINLFEFILKSVDYLNTTQNDTANFNLFFLYRIAALIGFKIDSSTYSQGCVFNVNDGTFVSPDTNEPYISGPNAAKTIFTLCTCQVEDLKQIALDRKSRSILLDIILLFYSIHLNTDLNVKSIRVIREVFED